MAVFFIGLVCIVAAIGITGFPRRQPDTLAPIQLITLTGVAALMLLHVAAAVATTYWWMTLPRGAVAGFALLYLIATTFGAVTACVILLRSRLRPRRAPPAAVDAWLRTEADTLEQIARGGHGIEEVVLYGGSADGTEIEAIRTSNGAAVRVGSRLPETLARFSRHPAGGPRRVRTLIRFILLHELGHLLNGDHLAYHVARATLLAQLWYLLPLTGLQPLLAMSVTRGASREELAAIGSMGFLLLATAIMVFFQRLVATRFAAARERLADWRATVTLTAEDRKHLLRALPDDSPFLEKALTALAVRPKASSWTGLLTLTWPPAESIASRVAQLTSGQSKGRHEPYSWSALAAVNVAALVVLVTSLAAPLVSAWGKSAAQQVALTIAVVLAAVPAAILVGRAERTELVTPVQSPMDLRIGTAGVYVIVQALGAIAGYLVVRTVPPLSPRQFTTAGTVIVMVTLVVAGVAFLAGTMIDLGLTVLRQSGEVTIKVIPFLLGLSAFYPFSVLLEHALGSQESWRGGLLLPTFAVSILGTVALQSRHAFLRRVSPLGMHGGSSIMRVRLLMTDVLADLEDIERRRLFCRLTLMLMAQTVMAFLFVAAVVVLLSGDSPDQAAAATFTLGFFVMCAVAVWPKKKSAPPTRIDRNIDLLLALFESGGEGPHGPLLERLKPSVANDLRNTPLRDADGTEDIGNLRRAAQRLELANAVGATDLSAEWRAVAADLLRAHAFDGVARAWPGAPPSAYWTAWAARLASAAGDAATARSLAHTAARHLPPHCINARAIQVAATVARLTGAQATPFALRSTDMHRLLRSTDSVSDLAAISPVLGSDDVELLRQVVRSRLWTTLHGNPRRQLLVILDAVNAGRQLGEGETPLWRAAEERLCELLLDDDASVLRELGAAA
jgi:Zn-dependent protease with chaperone function